MTTNNSINAPLPLGAPQGGTGIASPTAHTIPVAEGSSNFNFIGPLTNGQVLIGSTGADPVASTITVSGNLTTTSGAGTFNISTTGASSFTWVNQTSASATLAANTGYICNDSTTLITFTLPTTIAQGSIIEIGGFASGGWTISQTTGQQIYFGDITTTSGSGGSLSSTKTGDCVRLLCVTANTTFLVLSSVGNLTYV